MTQKIKKKKIENLKPVFQGLFYLFMEIEQIDKTHIMDVSFL